MTAAPEGVKDKQKRHWDSVADGWAAWLEWTERNFAPVTEWLRQQAGWQPGSRALDIGCGSGYPSLIAARHVAPGGSITAIDISPQMLAVAANAAQSRDVHNIIFRQMDAEHLDLPDASFDAVTNTYGLMFSADPVRAVSEIHRVLVPGGRVAIVVWADIGSSPFFDVITKVAAPVLGLAPPAPAAPGPFRFAAPRELGRAVAAGGFPDVSVDSCEATFEIASVSDYWRMFGDVAWKSRIATASDEQILRIREEVAEAVRPYQTDGRLCLVATSLCARARKRG